MKHCLFTLILLMLTLSASAGSKQKKKQKQPKKVEVVNPFEKGKGTVYIFGVGQQLTDEDVYFTEVLAVDSLDLDKKTKFLPFRYDFSLQMKEYLEGKLGLKKQTVCVFFSDNKKKIEKKYNKVKKRYDVNPDRQVTVIALKDFMFVHPLDTDFYK